jgi:hypothetical protein
VHTLVAVYGGDATHAAAQSGPIALTVAPRAITVTANPVSLLYGQGVPALTGTLNGVLAQDAGKVSAQFFVTAGALSPAGTYPIQVNLTGSAAGKYAVSMIPADVTIAQAPTSCILSSSTTAVGGNALTFGAQAISSTSGVPTGTITLLDGNGVVGTGTLSGGYWSYSLSSLAAGTHMLTAAYSGDSNFLPSTSPPVTMTVGGAPDFTLASSGTGSQTVAAGSAATFNFSVKMVGSGPASPIMLAVQGLPRGTTASLNPSAVPPGGAITSFTLTIQTPLAGLDSPRIPNDGGLGLNGGIAASFVLLPFLRRTRTLARRMQRRIRTGARLALALPTCILLASFASGCGDRVNGGSAGSHGSTYTITVTGTATGQAGNAIQHSANVILEVL